MKNMHKLTLATVLAAGFTLAGQVKADDSLLPPRAKELFSKTVARGAQTDPDLIKSQVTGPAAKAQAIRPSVVTSTKADPDLVRGTAYGAKNPLRDSQPQFEVAPLAKPGKQCEAGCTKACCEKK